MYGLATYDPGSTIGIFIIMTFIFKGITSYSLLYEKNYAIKLGKLDAIIGAVICVLMMSLPLVIPHFDFQIRIELLLLTPYYLTIRNIESEWEELKDTSANTR
jgi:hypothetical protein